MERDRPAGSPLSVSAEPAPLAAAIRDSSTELTGPGPAGPGGGARSGSGRPAAANAARERSRVQTLRHAFLELQRTLPSVPPDTKLSKLDVLLLATTYIAHLTRSLQDDAEAAADPGLGSLRGDGYLHPVKVSGRGRTAGLGPRPGHLDLPCQSLSWVDALIPFRVRREADRENDLGLRGYRWQGPRSERLLLRRSQVASEAFKAGVA